MTSAVYYVSGFTSGGFLHQFSTAMTFEKLFIETVLDGTLRVEVNFPNEVCQSTFEWALNFFKVQYKKE